MYCTLKNYVCKSIIAISLGLSTTYLSIASADVIDSLQPGHWLEISNTNLSSVYPSPTPGGNTGPSSIMSTWNGGAFDTKRNRLMVWGGGHMDYFGNEMYAFDISTMTWSRITDPSPTLVACTLYMSDGQPGIHHTYNTLQYSGLIDSFISVMGGGYGSNCGTIVNRDTTTDLFKISTNTWGKGSLQPASGGTIDRISAVDPATGLIYSHGTYGGSRLIEYNPLKDTWKIKSSSEYLEIGSTAAIDPIKRLMVAVGGYGGKRQIVVWDLTKDTGYGFVPTTSGDTTLEYNKNMGFQYDPTINKFVGWLDGTDVYVLDPTTWVWTKMAASSDNAVTPTAAPNGTFGRFRYIPSKNAYILVNSTTGNVYFYKLNSNSVLGKPNTPGKPSETVNPL